MGINNFNVMSLGSAKIFDPTKVGYDDSIEIIKEELVKTRKSFVKIGWYLKHIQEGELYKEDGFQNIYDFAFQKFNLSQPTATRFMKVCEKYSVNHDTPELDDKYVDYSVSQLFEMLPMTPEQEEKVTPETTVKEMRQIKKENLKGAAVSDIGDNAEDIIPGQTSIENDFPEYMPDKLENDEAYATSHKTETPYIDVEYREVHEQEMETMKENIEVEEGSEEPLASESEPANKFPVLKNNEQRKEWLSNYKAWGLWYRDEHIDVNYYKFDFEDGSRLIVAEYPQRYMYWKKGQEDQYYYHLLEKKSKGYGDIVYDKQYVHSTDSETSLLDFLKKIQNIAKEMKGSKGDNNA